MLQCRRSLDEGFDQDPGCDSTATCAGVPGSPRCPDPARAWRAGTEAGDLTTFQTKPHRRRLPQRWARHVSAGWVHYGRWTDPELSGRSPRARDARPAAVAGDGEGLRGEFAQWWRGADDPEPAEQGQTWVDSRWW